MGYRFHGVLILTFWIGEDDGISNNHRRSFLSARFSDDDDDDHHNLLDDKDEVENMLDRYCSVERTFYCFAIILM